jgi:hypothetical protein
MLCKFCQSIFQDDKAPAAGEWEYEQPHYPHYGVTELQESSQSGCHLCWTLWSAMDVAWRTKHSEFSDLFCDVYINALKEGGPYQLTFIYNFLFDEINEDNADGDGEQDGNVQDVGFDDDEENDEDQKQEDQEGGDHENEVSKADDRNEDANVEGEDKEGGEKWEDVESEISGYESSQIFEADDELNNGSVTIMVIAAKGESLDCPPLLN